MSDTAARTPQPVPTPSAPEGFELHIPAIFADCFLIPLKRLGTWNSEKAKWEDKAPAKQAFGWQKLPTDTRLAIQTQATGYGIPAGPNGFLFIDIDNKKDDEDGEKNLRALFESHGEGEWFETYEFRTGSGARQMCFTISPELTEHLKPSKGSTKNGITLGVDTRVKDSYSVGPGSLVVQDGTNEIGQYEETTPDRRPVPIENYPWFVEILKKSADKTWTNPTLAARKNSERKPTTTDQRTSSQVLRAHTGAAALEPVVEHLFLKVEGGAGRHPSLFEAGTQAGKRRVDREAFLSLAVSRIQEAVRDSSSKWFEYDIDHARTQLEAGWDAGHKVVAEREAAVDEFTAYRLALRFLALHPEFRWVVPQDDQRESAGHWRKFENNPRAKDCGIYKPLDQTVIRVLLCDWLTELHAEAEAAGDKLRATAALKARDSAIIDEVVRQLKGRDEVRAFIEDFDRHPHKLVDSSGIRDLNTMEVEPYDPSFLATRKIRFRGSLASYEKEAAGVEQIMGSCHPDDRAFLEAMLGTCLRNAQPLSKKGVIVYGPSKDNGKTTLMEILLAVLGEGSPNPFGLKAAHSVIHRQAENKYAEADLDGKTLTLLDDFAANREVDAEKLKQYIGSGQGYKARQIAQRTRSISLVHTFFLTCNRLPNFGRGEDVIDRFEVILFPYKYPSDDQYDAQNPWHRPRDPHFVARVGKDPVLQDAFYYYLLLLHKAWADSDSRVEIDSISDHMRESKADWKGKTNTLHALLTEHAAASDSYFVSESDLIAFITYKLKENGQGVFGTQALRSELEALHLLRSWGVERHSKKNRTRIRELRNLVQSRWRDPYTGRCDDAPTTTTIYSGLRLKTNEQGNLLTEDQWAAVLRDQELTAQAATEGRDEESVKDEARREAMAAAQALLAEAGVSVDELYALTPVSAVGDLDDEDLFDDEELF